MHSFFRSATQTLGVTRLALFAAALSCSTGLSAQQTTATQAPAEPAHKYPTLNLQAALKAPLDLSGADSDASSSSSSADGVATERLSLTSEGEGGGGGMQPPPRRRYGRPNYSDRYRNADGSNRFAAVVGGGFAQPAGSTGRYNNLSWSIKAGAGVNFSKNIGLLAEYNYDHFGIQGSQLAYLQSAYAAHGYDASGLDGGTHLWSLTLNPIITLVDSETSSFYITGGGGFYRKVTNLTLPSAGVYCDPYYGFCYQVTSNQTFDHYSNNAGGASLGAGFTMKPSRFSNQKFFAEARYVWVDNQPSSNSSNNFYPPNNYRTGYFPVTVGLRF